jgi:hypothetical protein
MTSSKHLTLRELLLLYAAAACFFLGFMLLCLGLRWNWIPGHLTPLYALFKPQALTLRHLIPVVLCLLYLTALSKVDRINTSTLLTLAFFVATSLLFSLAVASMNTGFAEVAAPFERYGLDYYGDVPLVRSPGQFLRDFAELRPHMSMHAKTHPPGPILLLWMLSFLSGGAVPHVAALVVALASLTVVPLYLFARDLAGREAANVAAALYVVTPTIVLYNATSMNGVYALFAVTTIFLFFRAMDRRTGIYAPLAGLAFALTVFMSYDMAILGIFFAVIFFSGIFDASRRQKTVRATVLMLLTFLAFYVALHLTTGFNFVSSLREAVGQVHTDLRHMQLYTPRASYWTWRFGNPFEVFFFAGIPVAVLFFAEWANRVRAKASRSREDKYLIAALIMLVVFNFAYLGKGENARVSSFYFPFIIVPASLYVLRTIREANSRTALYATVLLLFAQTWLMETLLYMYW